MSPAEGWAVLQMTIIGIVIIISIWRTLYDVSEDILGAVNRASTWLGGKFR